MHTPTRASCKARKIKSEVPEAETVNCWQATGCGREPGGEGVAELGVCPAAVDGTRNGVNRGVNGGRYCWRVAGTLCGGEVQGSFASKFSNCAYCEFFGQVLKDEGKGYQP